MVNKKNKFHTVTYVNEGSIAEELGIEPGDKLLEINGTPIEDIFDYHYAVNDTELVLLVEKPSKEQWELEIEKEYSEDLGIVFENGLMDEYRSCHNKCIFCFIDQMPPGMRDTLYFKDDDSRLSFLQGNYITLTNMSDHDAERIIRYHMAPINISVQTTNPELRCKMLHNRFAGDALSRINQFYEAGIEMNGQVVLCKNWNDKEELERTISDLVKLVPIMQSLSIVPVGLSKYRENLEPLEPLSAEDCRETIEIVEKWQRYCMEHFGIHFVQASDEFYISAGMEMPKEERYDGYIQLENGVGMVRLLMEEVREAIEDAEGTLHAYYEKHLKNNAKKRIISIGTGRLSEPYIKRLAEDVCREFPGIEVSVYAIRNDFFGELITVSGLITGQDLMAQLKGQKLGERLLLPINMFRSGEEVFLDDYTKQDAETALQVPIRIVKSSGMAFVESILGIGEDDDETPSFYEGYEVES